MNNRLEKILYQSGYDYIIGIDEVNVMSLAGVELACAIAMKKDSKIIPGVKDSKLLSRIQRERLYPKIKKNAEFISIGYTYVREIDEIGIYKGHILAKQRALNKILRKIPKRYNICIICDGRFKLNVDRTISYLAFPNADLLNYTVACASIVAKVVYDRHITWLSKKYPYYNFESNTGCPCKSHYLKIYEYGLSPVHRKEFCKSFPQLKEFFENKPCTYYLRKNLTKSKKFANIKA